MLDLLTGVLTGLSLIVAIGAQNAYVLRQGLLRNHVTAVVAICIVADVLLIAAGVAGLGVVVQRVPQLLTVLTWAGAAYLVCLAVGAFRRALTTEHLDPSATPPSGLRVVVLTTLALTFLNPHVYLDTVLMLGSIASTHGAGRWLFGSGAMIASVLWFGALGLGARALSRLVHRASTWRAIDVAVGCVMLAVAVRLVTL
ncbi:LysE/ArgO family amino acid transporter [Cumulibacter manganitolerans]|uniref:LysE/ArgO family amino acid transporter n=1 Tax=Cumulibacter manganitolerans TaxID=1884992 RepID=UPI0012979ECB|nr:LysE/ArgO family amino acid transporter [Cumulibacter manganitolerans]